MSHFIIFQIWILGFITQSWRSVGHYKSYSLFGTVGQKKNKYTDFLYFFEQTPQLKWLLHLASQELQSIVEIRQVFKPEPILFFFAPIFLSSNSFFFLPILLSILLII